MTSSDNDRKMSNLTSRSCRTQVFRSSSKVGCGVLDALGEPELDAVLGMGIGREPSQKPQEPLVSQANLSPLRHLEYSGPVAHACRIGRPGRRGELSVDILLNKKAAAALRREAGWSGGEQRDMSSSMATKTSGTCAHACWPRSRLYHIARTHASKTELRAGGGPTAASGFTSPACESRVSRATGIGAHLAGAPRCKIPGAEGFASLLLTMPGRSRRMCASKGPVACGVSCSRERRRVEAPITGRVLRLSGPNRSGVGDQRL